MPLRLLVLFCAVLALGLGVRAEPPAFPVDELRPGLRGVGRTVFSGGTIEEFDVHILGVLRNLIGPQRNLVLARLEGGPLAHTGVIAGMSGSPVYIDGKLLGAVSYSLGQFSKEPIAGITPIGEMVDATALGQPASRQTRPVAFGWRPKPDELLALWSRELGRTTPFVSDPAHASFSAGMPAGVPASISTQLQPIAMPLVASGFGGSGLAAVQSIFAGAGWIATSGSSGSQPPSVSAAALRPGDAVGVSLVSGDFTLGSTGTVTHVDGERVYAFGHPMFNLGPTEFPMTRADIHVVLPSLLQSSKLASFGDVIGTIQQDRATAVAGRLGGGPSTIPVKLTLAPERGMPRSFAFHVVRDHTFTPLLTYLAVANVLQSYERAAGPATYTVKGSATLRDYGTLAFEDIFTGDQPAGGAAAYVAGPLTSLLRNAIEPVSVGEISLTIAAAEQSRTARLERIWLDDPRPRAGRTVTVHAALRTPQGEELLRSIPLAIPAQASGSLQLLVGDASRLGQEDRRELRSGDPQRAAQLIRSFNRARRNNHLYVRLSSPEPGLALGGEALTSLPPSVLSVLEADRSGLSTSALREAPRVEIEVPVDRAVSGARTLTLQLDRQ